MPARYLMSWDATGRHRRWQKMFKGVRYAVTCEQLGLPPPAHTKESSYAAANDWWRAKLAGLAAAERDAEPAVVRETRRRADWLRQQGDHDGAEELDYGAEFVRRFPPAPVPRNADGLPVDPEIAAAEAVWADRLARTPAAESDTSVGRQAALYGDAMRAEAREGVRSHEGADAIARGLAHFVAHVGPAVDVNELDADRWHGWYVRCAGRVARHDAGAAGGWSADTAAKFFGLSRTFVRWCYEREHLGQLPRNLASRGRSSSGRSRPRRPSRTPR